MGNRRWRQEEGNIVVRAEGERFRCAQQWRRNVHIVMRAYVEYATLASVKALEDDIRLQGVFCSSDPEAHAGFTVPRSVHVKSIGASLERCE